MLTLSIDAEASQAFATVEKLKKSLDYMENSEVRVNVVATNEKGKKVFTSDRALQQGIKSAAEAYYAMQKTPSAVSNSLASTLKELNAWSDTLATVAAAARVQLNGLSAGIKAAENSTKAVQNASAALLAFDAASHQNLVTSKQQLKAKQAMAEATAMESEAYKKASADLLAADTKVKELTRSQKLLAKAEQKLADLRAMESPEIKAVIADTEKLALAKKMEALRTTELTRALLAAERARLHREDPEIIAARAAARPIPVARTPIVRSPKSPAGGDDGFGNEKTIKGFHVVNQAATAFRATLQGLHAQIGIYTSSTILVAAATYKLMEAIRSTVKTGIEFTSQMSMARAIMDGTYESFVRAQEEVVRLGSSTIYSATEVAKGFVELGQAGFSAQEAISSLSAVLDLAMLGSMDFAAASEIATNVMAGFGVQARDLGGVVDVLAKAAVDSNVTVQSLGTTMSYVAPIAESFGVALTDVVAAAEVLGNAGIKASRGGTTLRRTVESIYTPTKKGEEALHKLGVTTSDYEGKAKPLAQVLKELSAATEGATKNVGELQEIVGLYALAGFTQLIAKAGDASRGMDHFTSRLEDASGAAKVMGAVATDNLGGDLKRLGAAFDALQNKSFASVESDLRGLTQTFTGTIKVFMQTENAVKLVTGALKELAMIVGLIIGAGALVGLFSLLGRVAGALKVVGTGIKEVAKSASTKAFATTATEMKALEGGLKGISGMSTFLAAAVTASLIPAIIRLGGVMAASSLGLGAWAVAAVAIVAGVTYLTGKLDALPKLFSSISDSWDTTTRDMEERAAKLKELMTVNGKVDENQRGAALALIGLPEDIKRQGEALDELKKKLAALQAIKDAMKGDLGYEAELQEAQKAVDDQVFAMDKLKLQENKLKTMVQERLVLQNKMVVATYDEAVAKARVLNTEAMGGFDAAMRGGDLDEINEARQRVTRTTLQLVAANENLGSATAARQMSEAAISRLEQEAISIEARLTASMQDRAKITDNVAEAVAKLKKTLADASKSNAQLHKEQVAAADAELKKVRELLDLYDKGKLDKKGQEQLIASVGRVQDIVEERRKLSNERTTDTNKEAAALKKLESAELSVLSIERQRAKELRDARDLLAEAGVALGDSSIAAIASENADSIDKLTKNLREDISAMQKAMSEHEKTGKGLEKLKATTDAVTDSLGRFNRAGTLRAKFDSKFALSEAQAKLAAEYAEAVNKLGATSEEAAKKFAKLRQQTNIDLAPDEFTKTIEQWKLDITDLDKIGADWLTHFKDAVVDFASGGKGAFKSFFEYVKRALLDLTVKEFIVNVKGVFGGTGASGGLLSTLFGGTKTNQTQALGQTPTGQPGGGMLGWLGSAMGLGGLFSNFSIGAGAGMHLLTTGGTLGGLFEGAGALLGAGEFATGLGMLAPILAPVLAIGGLLAGIFGRKKRKEQKTPNIRMAAVPKWAGYTSSDWEDQVSVVTPFSRWGLGKDATEKIDAQEWIPFFEEIRDLDRAFEKGINILPKNNARLGENLTTTVRNLFWDKMAKYTESQGLGDFRNYKYFDMFGGTLDLKGRSDADIQMKEGVGIAKYYELLFEAGAEAGSQFAKVMGKELSAYTKKEGYAWYDEIMDQMNQVIEDLTAAFTDLQAYMDSDLVKEYAKQVRLANETIYDKMVRLGKETITSLDRAVTNATLENTQKLATSVKSRYEAEMALLAQITDITKGLKESTKSTLEKIRLDTYDEQKKYNYYKEKAETAANKIKAAIDPADVQKFAQEAMDAATQAWDLMPEDIKKALVGGYESFFKEMQAVSDSSLQVTKEQTLADAEILREKVAQFVTGIYEVSSDASAILSGVEATNEILGTLASGQESAAEISAVQMQQQYDVLTQIESWVHESSTTLVEIKTNLTNYANG